MLTTITQFLQRKALFVLLLPVTWVLHGYYNNYGLIPTKDAVVLTLFYCGLGFMLTVIFWLFYKNILKAALLTFFILSLQFYFGTAHDFLKEYFSGIFISKYTFLLLFIIAAIIFISVYLARSKKNFYRVTLYLNTLMIFLIVTDIFLLAIKNRNTPQTKIKFNEELKPCYNCDKPDIYLIVADGYPGYRQLKDLFNFDNSKFENALRERDFYIVDSSISNYNFTQYSIASMLSMNYLKAITHINSSKTDIKISRNVIKNSPVVAYLINEGYRFYNYSIFDFEGEPSITTPTFLPRKLEPITRHTLSFRIMKDLGYHLVTTFKIKFIANKILTADLENNQKIYAATQDAIHKESDKPKLVYTHLMMPHHPFYYDSNGKRLPLELLKENFYYNKEARISYLKYTNKELLKLIDEILMASKQKPVIFLLGDHGIREFSEQVDPHYQFMNLNAILLPDKEYNELYKGMSNVNLFRFFLNKKFQQNLPFLPDSTILISD